MSKGVEIISGPYDPGGQPTLDTPNKVSLGVFAWNLACGTSITKAVLLDRKRRRDYWMWPSASQLMREADRIGCEFEVPFGRWLGHDGEARFNEEALDFLTASAGLAPITSRMLISSTSHIGYGFHPLQFAKWGATIDHMSQGRWALNVVAGWIRDEVALFGGTFLDHDLRYAICDEFVTFIKHCWSRDEPFDFEGRFFRAKNVYVSPKPIRKPRPILLNAGFSPAGTDFAAKNCDWLFTSGNSVEQLGQIAKGAQKAAGKYGRQLRIVTFVWGVWAETDQRAEEEVALAREMLDEHATSWFTFRSLDQPGTKAGASFAPAISGQSEPTLRQAIGEEAFVRVGLGLNGYHVVGGYDSVAEQIRKLYEDYGQEGILVSWLDPLRGLHQLEDHIIPRLRKMGLRK
jgi:FMNH2-dependent dimethyl sulfone monooxygenase